MGLVSAIAIYIIIWWLVIFAVLPWGVRNKHEAGVVDDVADDAAPIEPGLGKKVIATTIISAIIFAGFYVVYTRDLVSLDDFPLALG